MEWKMFGVKEKLASLIHNVFKMFRLSCCPVEKDCNVSSPTPTFTAAPYEPVNPLANYSLEAELRKAQALMYQRMLHRPK